jgi:putative ABC transport system permease protein
MRNWHDEIKSQLESLKIDPAREVEIVDELSLHLQDVYDDARARGLSDADAYRAALEELAGGEAFVKGFSRIRQGDGERPVLGASKKSPLADLWYDVRYGLRALRKSPGFTAVAVLSLALGVGANTAIFQLLDAVLMRALPVSSPQELVEVRIGDQTGARGSFNTWHPAVTHPIWERFKQDQEAFSSVFVWGEDSFNVAPSGVRHDARALWVSGNLFDSLGVRPILGRVIAESDDVRGVQPVTVISYAFWQREYGGNPDVVGRTISLDGHEAEIVGVAQPSFFGLEVGRSFDVAVPVGSEPILRGENSSLDSGTTWWLTIVGRLKPDWTIEQADAHVNALSPALFQATLSPTYPTVSVNDYLGMKLSAIPAGAGVSQLRDDFGTPLWLLLTIAGLVLLIACANLANLLLARASAREREIAVRLALGASRSRLVRQLMTESMLVAALGAAAGMILAYELSAALVAFLSTTGNPLRVDLTLDWRVLAFTSGLAVMTCMLFGLAPALTASHADPGTIMRASGRGLTAGSGRFGLRRMLVVTQVAISLVLMVAAFLFTRSLTNLMRVETGFRQGGIVIASVDSSEVGIPKEALATYKQGLLERMEAIPGVESVSTTSIVPLSGGAWANMMWMDGGDRDHGKSILRNRVGPDFFETLETPILAGRTFDDRDHETSPKVAIVNESFARVLSDGENPVGRRFWIEVTPNDPVTVFEIVGLVRDAKYMSLREERAPVAYFPMTQNPRPGPFDRFVIRSAAASETVLASIRSTLAEIDPRITFTFGVLESQIQESLLQDRLVATLAGFFGLLAAVLSIVGLYGVVSYSAARRTHEIGIRMSLGANRRDIVALIMREAGTMLIAGLAIGTLLALVTAHVASSQLFGIQPHDPASIAGAALLLAAVAAVASLIPARRAARLDPMDALKEE